MGITGSFPLGLRWGSSGSAVFGGTSWTPPAGEGVLARGFGLLIEMDRAGKKGSLSLANIQEMMLC